MSGSFTKDPSATLDYTVDWSEWLGTDQITDAAWTVPTGLKIVKSTFNATTVTIWLSGGTVGISYAVTCEISTDQGRIDSRELIINVTDK